VLTGQGGQGDGISREVKNLDCKPEADLQRAAVLCSPMAGRSRPSLQIACLRHNQLTVLQSPNKCLHGICFGRGQLWHRHCCALRGGRELGIVGFAYSLTVTDVRLGYVGRTLTLYGLAEVVVLYYSQASIRCVILKHLREL
jgi:hypothetical protein